MFWLESFYKAQDNRGQLPSSFFLDPSVIQLTKSPKIQNLRSQHHSWFDPPTFCSGNERAPKTNPMALVLLSVGFLNSQNMETTLTWKRIFQVGFKRKTTYFHSYFSSPPVTTCYFSSPPSWFQSTFQQKKGSPPVFQPSAPSQPAGFFVSPTTPQDQDSGLKLKMFACGGSTDVLLGWPVCGWT